MNPVPPFSAIAQANGLGGYEVALEEWTFRMRAAEMVIKGTMGLGVAREFAVFWEGKGRGLSVWEAVETSCLG